MKNVQFNVSTSSNTNIPVIRNVPAICKFCKFCNNELCLHVSTWSCILEKLKLDVYPEDPYKFGDKRKDGLRGLSSTLSLALLASVIVQKKTDFVLINDLWHRIEDEDSSLVIRSYLRLDNLFLDLLDENNPESAMEERVLTMTTQFKDILE